MVGDTVTAGILYLDVNESTEGDQLSASADCFSGQHPLQPRHQDDLPSYAEEDIKQAMLKEFQQLQQQHVGTTINKNNLTDKQHRKIINTRWAVSGKRPSSSSSSRTTLKARFCGKGFTQRVDNANVETYAANTIFSKPSSSVFLSTASSTTGK